MAAFLGACLMNFIMYLIMISMTEKNVNDDSKDIAIMENWEKEEDNKEK
jgi:hypothetical protein